MSVESTASESSVTEMHTSDVFRTYMLESASSNPDYCGNDRVLLSHMHNYVLCAGHGEVQDLGK